MPGQPRSTGVPNPWRAIDPARSTHVLAEDEPHIRAFNATLKEGSSEALDLSLLPDPWVGRLDAPVVLLNLNPGRSPDDLAAQQLPEVRAAIMRNLRQEATRFPLFYLDPTSPMAETPGGKWWSQRLGQLIKRFGAARVAQQVVCLEFHGYHSVTYSSIPVTLPSQWYVFDALRAAIRRDAIVVALRGQKSWQVAVPELRDHKRVFAARTARSPFVSPNNCPDGWEHIVAVIEAADG